MSGSTPSSDTVIERAALKLSNTEGDNGETLGYFLRLGMLTKNPDATEDEAMALLEQGSVAVLQSLLPPYEEMIEAGRAVVGKDRVYPDMAENAFTAMIQSALNPKGKNDG